LVPIGDSIVTVRDLSYAGLESALNGYLGLDAVTRERLAALHGRTIGVEVLGLGLSLFFTADEAGALQVYGRHEGEPDCWLRGTPLDLLRAGDHAKGPDQLFSQRVRIEGDSALAQRFGAILADVDIDWEEHLSRLVGDVVAHEVGGAARAARAFGRRTGRTAEQNLREYLQEEARLLPTRYELKELLDAVDVLRDDVERLAARVERLRRRAGGAGEAP
jgi:ubiquinone biosynthesis protein UbiJ